MTKKIVFETPEGETIKPGDLSTIMSSVRVDFFTLSFKMKIHFKTQGKKSYLTLLPDKLARSTL